MAKQLTIGSAALDYRRVLKRTPSDIDVIVDPGFFFDHLVKEKGFDAIYPTSGTKWFGKVGDTIYEYEIAWEGSSAEHLLQRHETRDAVATAEECLALKLSHRYLKDSPHFYKTMMDIWEFRNCGVVLDQDLKDWLPWRERETYAYEHPSLSQSKDEFFSGDGITYVYVHDDIHEAVKLGNKPAYTYFQEGEVWCSKDKFFDSPYEVRLNAVVEESMVLAIERSLVPHPDVLTPRKAFLKALEKVCTSITSGWFREFAWENYHHAIDKTPDNFYAVFKREVEAGNVKTV